MKTQIILKKNCVLVRTIAKRRDTKSRAVKPWDWSQSALTYCVCARNMPYPIDVSMCKQVWWVTTEKRDRKSHLPSANAFAPSSPQKCRTTTHQIHKISGIADDNARIVYRKSTLTHRIWCGETNKNNHTRSNIIIFSASTMPKSGEINRALYETRTSPIERG